MWPNRQGEDALTREQLIAMQQRLRLLAEVTRTFAEATVDVDRLLALVARRIAEVIGDTCTVMILDPSRRALERVAAHDPDPDALARSLAMSGAPLLLEAHAIPRSVIQSGEPMRIARMEQDHLGPAQTSTEVQAFVRARGIHSMVFVPLRGRTHVLGLLVLSRHRPDRPEYDEHDVDLACALADHAALAIENARAFASELAARRAAEQAAAESREFFEGSQIPKFAFAVEGERIVAVNDAALRLYGYTREEFLTLDVDQLRAPHDAAQLRARNQAAGDRPVVGPGRHRRKDGSMIDVEGSSHLATYAGRQTRFVSVNDVTERNRALAALAELRETMATESKFRAFIELAPDAIVIVDREGRIVLVNYRTETMFGYPRAELLGQPIELLVPLRARPGHDAQVARAFEDPTLRSIRPELMPTGLRKDGSEFPIEVSLGPLSTDQGLLVNAVIRDVTDRKQIEAALVAANHELEAFSYSVAHDLRSPLRAMSGFASLLLEEHAADLDEEGRHWLVQIVQGAGKLGELVDALLSLARLSRSEVKLTRIDLSALARSVATEQALRDPDHRVAVEIAAGLVAEADPRLARVLLENLLANARKFSAQAADPRIEVGQQRGDRRAFFVRDNGAGFDMAYATKLFAPFQRLHATREFPGSGIGLATVQRIVRRHGGEIWAEGEVGKGATFWFELPARPLQELGQP